MRLPLPLPLLLALLLGPAGTVVAQSRPDVSGVDGFWVIADRLVADVEPGPGEWRALLDTPAYRQLAQDARQQRMLRLAFRPSFGRQADSVLATGSFDARVVAHLRRVRDRRATLQAFRDSLAKADPFVEAGPRAAAYLPAGELDRRSAPRLAYALFGPEAYGAEEGIVIDLLFAMDRRGAPLVALIAHEVHHYHVGYLTGLRFPPRAAPAFQLLQALRNLANEGTADRIDLRFPVGPPAIPEEVSPTYNAAYRDAERTLHDVDSVLSAIGSDTARLRAAGRDLANRLVFAGHPVGALMAERIEEQLGRAALVAAVGDPFAFLRRYDEAEQRRRGARPFSERTSALFRELEREFVTPRAR